MTQTGEIPGPGSWALIMVDLHGRILSLNTSCLEIIGPNAGDLVGRELGILGVGEKEKLSLKAGLARAVQGESHDLHIWMTTQKGSTENFRISFSPLFDGGGKVSAVLLGLDAPLFSDAGNVPSPISGEADDLYRGFFESDITGNFISTESGRITDCNTAFVDMFGFAAKADAVGSSLEVLFPSKSRFESLMEELARDLLVRPRETRWKKRDGTDVDILLNLRWITEKKGKAGFFYGSLVDITDKKKIEQEFFHSQKLESIGRLAGGIAHDFNNILQAILAAAESLGPHESACPDLHSSLGEIRASIRRASRLTRRLLLFARNQVLDVQKIEMRKVVEPLLKMLRRLVGEDLRLDFEAGPGGLYIEADAGQIEQILMNLVVNARDATGPGGRILIRCYRREVDGEFRKSRSWATADSYVVLEVSDSGEGIPEELRSKIFEPFFTTKESDKGTGLGLATVFGIVSQHDGAIEVDSEPGRGATFSVFLPEKPGPLEEESPAEGKEYPLLRRKYTVLFAEDDRGVRKVVSRALVKTGLEVLTAGDGQEAIEIFLRRAPEISAVILDVIMPGLGGMEVTRRILEIAPDIPILLTTGYSDTRLNGEIIKRENIELLMKPYSVLELFEKLHAAIRKRDHA